MTIASKLNAMAVANGGTADKSGTITGALDALNDALAGSDYQTDKSTIETALDGLGANIGGGSVAHGVPVFIEVLNPPEDELDPEPESTRLVSFYCGVKEGERTVCFMENVGDGADVVRVAGGYTAILDLLPEGASYDRGVDNATLDGEPFTDYTVSSPYGYANIAFTVPMFGNGDHQIKFTLEREQ